MNAGTVAAIIVAAGYIGFELHAVSRAGYRMEPSHILGEFATAQRGAEVCGDPDAATHERFVRNYAWTQRRARTALGDTDPTLDPAQLDARIAEQINQFHAQVDTLIADHGCKHIDVWRLVKRHDNLARLNLPQPKS